MSDAKLEFVPVHRYITVEMPDKHRYQMRVSFAVMTFLTVAEICRDMGIRHPEELSLLRSPLDKENFAKLTGWVKKGRKVRREITKVWLRFRFWLASNGWSKIIFLSNHCTVINTNLSNMMFNVQSYLFLI